MSKTKTPSHNLTKPIRSFAAVVLVLATLATPLLSPSGRLPGVSPAQAAPATQDRLSPFKTGPTGDLSPPSVWAPNQNVSNSPPLSSERHQYQYVALGGTPSGPLYSRETFLGRISAPTAWSNANASNVAPTIAVIDTGFALNHEDLVGRWDGTQGSDSWAGWDFVDGTNNPLAGKSNPNGAAVFHGTMTAGLAGLLNPNAKLMPLQALDDNGVGYTNTVAAAVTYAADNGANIISLSLGSSSDDPYLHQQIDYAISRGVLVVAAAGNSGCNCLSYPAAYPEVLSVGASTSSDARASFSSYGSNLDVLAPGTAGDVCSAFYTSSNATNAYSCGYSGTSFSTPLTSGLAALLLQQNPANSPLNLIAIITQTADKLPAMGGQNRTLTEGYGRIDAAQAVAAVNLAPPRGELLSRSVVSLSASNPITGPQMDSTCSGVPGATCDVTLTGPQSQIIDLGTQTLDSQYGGAEFIWNAATLGLVPGQWTITATTTAYGQTITSTSQAMTIDP